jgi:nicotinate-nucleotide pyrophosphorylase (carboxylating)
VFEHNETLEQARQRNVRDALREDVGVCDWTASLLPADTLARAALLVREDAILCGTDWFDACVMQLDPDAVIQWHARDGDAITAGMVICDLRGSARALLTAERSAMNFLQLLSATASQTRHMVRAIEGVSPNPNGCVVLDTRKTIPGLRQAQKYAVRVGGGMNHRMALWDGILIKENHILAAGGIRQALQAATALHANVPIQIEVETLDELDEALSGGATSILLDNFDLAGMRAAVARTRGQALLEASGGIDFESIRDVAATGVDRISIGQLTKNIRAIDYSLRVTARSGDRMVG